MTNTSRLLPTTALLLTAAVGIGAALQAQATPYAGLEARAIKALSADQIAGYRSGSGMGLALAAELNGLPGPKHVLELADELELSAEQVAATRAVFETMKAASVDLGTRIVDLEARLDESFRGAGLSESGLAEQVDAIAVLQGKLRFGHLRAHLQMADILTPQQAHKYAALRGYESGEHTGHHEGHDPARH